MGHAQFFPKEREADYCQLFVETLVGLALTTFSRLEAYSIGKFCQLSTTFLKYYSMYIQQSTSNTDLSAMNHTPKETLHSYIDRFKAIVS